MNLIIMMIIMSTVLSLILIFISFWLPINNPDLEKLSPYECGFDPTGSARLPFSIRFFLIAILFLLFDLEIALLLPTPWASQSMYPQLTLMLSTIILIMLSIGLLYEWMKGGLEWAE
uniref:NADH-ubiquinone oxidoreductase chain 3 n=2 Tax=Onychodactylus TaxID=113381 RepID=A0A8K1XF26_9AMPH|nr:NADH dehydrogenase subunit 3 [Onychodactylus fischeri]UHM25432.1 NADH dehydrogenase subunit 3 [Onychodactylus zhaoermii]ABC56106.1 NADH dehydrogenase subunit 3 [Onychodactylus fischeri]UHM25445.1 NADH dehydrogenase subunit 3 [Onychodactylus zhaoermii]UHM25458.1 NADH dehydrogenase subunit 3 [Onychodactylus zhaoermii]UHM25471.1 NADH dehydrogenase subunit 3 [Onychodactylus zhaoermii]